MSKSSRFVLLVLSLVLVPGVFAAPPPKALAVVGNWYGHYKGSLTATDVSLTGLPVKTVLKQPVKFEIRQDGDEVTLSFPEFFRNKPSDFSGRIGNRMLSAIGSVAGAGRLLTGKRVPGGVRLTTFVPRLGGGGLSGWTRIVVDAKLIRAVKKAGKARARGRKKKKGSPADYLGEVLLGFRPRATVAKLENGRWKLVFKNVLLKDFGASRENAVAALRVIQKYQPDAKGQIGTPTPVVEYFTVASKAISGALEGEDSIAFDLRKLRVAQQAGAWKIFAGDRALVDFGKAGRELALNAIKVFRVYGFTHICYIGGRTKPAMTYLRK